MNGFDINSTLGKGSFGEVYKVKRLADDKIYALKKVNFEKLSTEAKESMINEVRLLASVKSTFVISYKDAFFEEKEQSFCIVMEYADKGDLYQKITEIKKNHSLFEETDVWRIFIQIVKGLNALHELKIFHGDIKPSNVFLFEDGSVKLGDLNVSKVLRKGFKSDQVGTPFYSSPEMWNGSIYDTKSDIWSLGCLTYEMVTLKPPFNSETMKRLCEKITKGIYSKLSISCKYSRDVSQVIEMMLKVDPMERPSCSEILQHPLILKRIAFFKSNANFENIDFDSKDKGELLKTIYMPKNILDLNEQLPGENYDGKVLIRNQIKRHTEDNKTVSPSREALPDIKAAKKLPIIESVPKNSLEKIIREDSKNNNENTNKSCHKFIDNKNTNENTNKASNEPIIITKIEQTRENTNQTNEPRNRSNKITLKIVKKKNVYLYY